MTDDIDILVEKTPGLFKETLDVNEREVFDQTYDMCKRWQELDMNGIFCLLNKLNSNFHVYKFSINWDPAENKPEGLIAKKHIDLFLQEQMNIQQKMEHALIVHQLLKICMN